MRKIKWVVMVAAAAAAVLWSVSYVQSAAEKRSNDELYREVELFSDALTIVQDDYVDDISTKKIIYGALKGMLASLDPHSQFLDPDTYSELKVDTEGKFGGIGIEITLKDGLLTVVTPIEGTPAWKAGLKANDRIVKVNKEITRDLTLTEAVKKLRGKAGEAVDITVLRESEQKLLDFHIVRDVIKIKDIKEALILEDGIGYIRLVEFRENTAQDIDNILGQLTRSGMKALVLDLRNNPGGLLDVAVRVAEKFLPKGELIVYTKGRKDNQNMKFVSRARQPYTMPVVVLINEGSASGSEIVAACLQDHKRAVIVGMKSFGKGSVQTIIPLSDGSALKLTTSKYFSPLGREIHGKGVPPDVVAPEARLEQPKTNAAEEKKNEIFEGVESPELNHKGKDNRQFDYKADSQLTRAVDILKAIDIYVTTRSNK
ncbi:MAG: S41 family peptidase [Candidatus Omnitrophota bacterium]|jgi:carboxyl-terminal processing protease